MRSRAKYLFGTFFLFFPALASAQHLGQVTCARRGDYTYLYSSITTMEVLRTLQCGEQVEVTGRNRASSACGTANGETGYIGEGSLVLLKDKLGAKARFLRPRKLRGLAPLMTSPHPRRLQQTAFPAGFDLTLPNDTPIHLKFSKAVSSETAHVGDVVDLVVAEDVVVDGLCVIPSGASAEGVVTEAEAQGQRRKA
jgi:hypothetical protein